ncbi:hypothetical protein PCANC_20189 [Puccinia coronata f. sp. avenae]|uniref:RING-type domain-containing protein n=1 Tax=Puccinia coronata f. sp. avenae TaxID=200324 RepID=A0A2N5S6K6_9BASI|nr:hypothetical protein PCANC_23830 [Puccinia coronata f. sp. avenae]PLW29701.1 hypothetical protein PCANC_20189 [Puccinia coronata f. sp. avenae]PLW47765.1 hypothetical protein PCASD_04372 [Puccinia coronata f. sp. avenae]
MQSPPTEASPESAFTPDDDVFDYLAEPNENLICPICRNPFIEPVMCESTDHVFCRICLIKSLEISPTCPIDRLPLSLSLVIPAPKLITKLVDELLVSCPFKSKLGCSFVCQRDLIAAHLRSHQTHFDHPDLCSYIAPQHQDPPPSNLTASQPSLPQHFTSTPSPQLRFQWVTGRAVFVPDPSNLSSSSSPGQMSSNTNSTQDESESTHCPFERFGCSFVGTCETINELHLPPYPDLSASSEDSRCPFLSVREILYWFEHLEARNLELKEQLSRSLVQRSELTSVLDNLKASFRQLWLSRQSGHHNPPLVDPPTHHSSPFAPVQPPSTFPRSECPDDLTTVLSNPSPIGMSIPDLSSPTRRSSDSFLHMNSSRMNYDSLNGHRLKYFDHYPSHSGLPGQFYRALGSASSPSKAKIRVSTFLRRGEIVTPTSDNFDHPALLSEPSIGPLSQHATCISPQISELTASPRPADSPHSPARSSPYNMFNIPSFSHPHIESSHNVQDPHAYLLKQASPFRSSHASETISHTPRFEPMNEHAGLLNGKISALVDTIQSTLSAWHLPGRIVLPSDLGACDRAGPDRRKQAHGAAAHQGLISESTLSDSAAETRRIGSDEQQKVLTSLAKIEQLIGALIDQAPTSRAPADSSLGNPSRQPSKLACTPSPSLNSLSPPLSASHLSPHTPLTPSSSRATSHSSSDDLMIPSGSTSCSAHYYPSSVRPMKL